ncbi:MAG: hypothetical protein ACYCWE_14700 [Eubacteriales bacterium]
MNNMMPKGGSNAQTTASIKVWRDSLLDSDEVNNKHTVATAI